MVQRSDSSANHSTEQAFCHDRKPPTSPNRNPQHWQLDEALKLAHEALLPYLEFLYPAHARICTHRGMSRLTVTPGSANEVARAPTHPAARLAVTV
jgi:hypothetical protein